MPDNRYFSYIQTWPSTQPPFQHPCTFLQVSGQTKWRNHTNIYKKKHFSRNLFQTEHQNWLYIEKHSKSNTLRWKGARWLAEKCEWFRISRRRSDDCDGKTRAKKFELMVTIGENGVSSTEKQRSSDWFERKRNSKGAIAFQFHPEKDCNELFQVWKIEVLEYFFYY